MLKLDSINSRAEGALQRLYVLIRLGLLVPLCFVLFSAHAQELDLSIPITLNLKNVPSDKVVKMIAAQSDCDFSYSSKLLDSSLVSFKVNEVPLGEVLDQFVYLLDIEYVIIENQIILKKPKRKEIVPESQPDIFTLCGYMTDKETGESLIGATVYIEELKTGATTNPYGFFSLSIPTGNYNVLFSYIGYSNKEFLLEFTDHIDLSIGLIANMEVLSEVTVKSDEVKESIEKCQMSRLVLKPQNLINIPEFGGEVGLVKSLQTLPGIKAHSDGSSFFFVRGGDRDQNLVVIDDAPVFNHSHLFGYYSAINPDAARDIKIYKSDFPAYHGDRISSVIDIHTKEGNMHKLSLQGMLNPLIYGLTIEGPFKKEKASFFLSYRHSNFKWIYRRHIPELDLYMFDLNAKVNVKLNKKNRLFLTLYGGRDNLTNNNEDANGGIRWDNVATSLRWNRRFSSRLFLNSVLHVSAYNYYLMLGDITWNSAIENVGLKFNFAWYPTTGHNARFGFQTSSYSFNPGNFTDSTVSHYIAQVPQRQSQKHVFYFSDEYSLGKRFSVKAGFRLPIWTNIGPTIVYSFDDNHELDSVAEYSEDKPYKRYVNLDTRLGLKYRFGEFSSLKLSYGRYHQYIQMLTNSISPFSSFELWLPAGMNIKPQRADQLSLGLTRYFEKAGIEFTSEIYYKKMANQIDYKPHADLLLNPLIEGELRLGQAKSYGVEILFKKNAGRLNGWMSYTLSKVLKETEGINKGNEYPAFYDRPHDFTIYLNYAISERTSVSANWVYYTGSAITTPVGYYDYNGYTVPIYDEKNNDRLPDYHRLDLALDWRLNKVKRTFNHNLSFSIFNFYNRMNPVSVNFNKMETDGGGYTVPSNVFNTPELETTQKTLMSFMPSITYKFSVN